MPSEGKIRQGLQKYQRLLKCRRKKPHLNPINTTKPLKSSINVKMLDLEEAYGRKLSTKILPALTLNHFSFQKRYRSYIHHPMCPINKHHTHIPLNAHLTFPIPHKDLSITVSANPNAPTQSIQIEGARKFIISSRPNRREPPPLKVRDKDGGKER